MKIIDISLPINNGTLAHPSENFLKIEPNRTFEKNGVRSSKITIGSHTGTHIDAPSHFLKKGKAAEQTDLAKCMGIAQVLEIPKNVDIIEKKHISGKITSSLVLFKTNNSGLLKQPYTKSITTLGLSAAEYLAYQGVVLVGIDYIGIEASGSVGHPVHNKLLEKEILILEGLDLSKVKAGEYRFLCLPLNLTGLDGSPARAILIVD
ncbi:MAG: cyclase family protein [Candidatus Woykebacteria bacterium]